MSEQVTVYLNARVSPSGTDWHRAELRNHTSSGVWIVDRVNFREQVTFYPAHQVQRIEYHR